MHFGACMDGAPHTHVPDACEHAQMWGPFCAQGGSPHQTVVAGQAAASDEGTRRLALLGLAASRHQRQAASQPARGGRFPAGRRAACSSAAFDQPLAPGPGSCTLIGAFSREARTTTNPALLRVWPPLYWLLQRQSFFFLLAVAVASYPWLAGPSEGTDGKWERRKKVSSAGTIF